MTAQQAQRVIADLFRDITGQRLVIPTAREYFQSWVANKKSETAPNTYAFYRDKAQRFLDWLGSRADQQIALITRDDIVAFRAAELERIAPPSVNHELKFLRMVFKAAKAARKYHDENPVSDVKVASPRGAANRRRPFTVEEIERLLSVADDEWRSLILFGLYTGQRLGDLARLTWANLDLQKWELRFVTSKTGRQQIIPLAEPLQRHVESLRAVDNPRQPLHPRAFASVQQSGKVGMLSRQFYELMADAGMLPAKKHRARENAAGRNGRRDFSEISFHALRYTATSLMKNAGISAAIVQDIIGHESATISAHYTHIDEASKRIALEKLPDI